MVKKKKFPFLFDVVLSNFYITQPALKYTYPFSKKNLDS